ncbi:MAG: AraC family transcriptional regulator [Lachnospiraceae bacterium]|nr:AraC family transcriptional regulator [Lachnospiraceae bacterium]
MSSDDRINRRNFLEYDLSIGGCDLRSYEYIYAAESMGSWEADRHSHSHFEFHVIISGTCSFEAEEEKFTLKAGDLVMIRPGCYHASGNTSEDFLKLGGGFSYNGDPFLELGSGGVIFSEASAGTLALCRLFQTECGPDKSFSKEMMIAMGRAVTISVWRDLFSSVRKEPDLEDTLDFENRTCIIDRFFQKNYAKQISEDDLAELLHISRRQLVRVLKESYGKSFRERLLETRMEHASWLLKTTGEKTNEIAGHVGYASEAAFYRAFKSYYGMTPSEYRK